MSDLLLSNAKLIDPEGAREFEGALYISGGQIKDIIPKLPENNEKISKISKQNDITIQDCGGKYLAPGIIDIGVKVGEPGERHKESFRSAGLAAAAGGVTTMVIRPDTSQPIDTPETLEFTRRRAREFARVNSLHIATLTKGRAGEEMSEIGLLQDAGAVAFSDGDQVIRDTKILGRAMRYAATSDALIIGHPQEPILSAGACTTSGAFATKLGLPSVSPMAEKLGLQRDMAMVEMTGARYHADQLTTQASLPVLARAKEAGLGVSAGVSVHHLTLNEFDIGDYRTFFKLKPPLRAEEDRLAVVEALKDGLLDVICSMHTPQDEESKRLPFEEAAAGAVGLETLLPASLQLLHEGSLDLPSLFKYLSYNPAKIIGSPAGRLTPGAPADLILFDPDIPFVMSRYDLQSKSKNTPYDERKMQGQMLRTWVAGEEIFAR